jgi:hypothetical protein
VLFSTRSLRSAVLKRRRPRAGDQAGQPPSAAHVQADNIPPGRAAAVGRKSPRAIFAQLNASPFCKQMKLSPDGLAGDSGNSRQMRGGDPIHAWHRLRSALFRDRCEMFLDDERQNPQLLQVTAKNARAVGKQVRDTPAEKLLRGVRPGFASLLWKTRSKVAHGRLVAPLYRCSDRPYFDSDPHA